jgi:hypothetical protein
MAIVPAREGKGKAAAWKAHSARLAAWADRYLVNRDDAWGRYLPLAERTAKHSVVTCTGTLTRTILARHFQGADQGDLIGLHTTSPDNTCRWLLIDIDRQDEQNPKCKKANRKAAFTLNEKLRDLGLMPLLTASNGKGGYHILVIFSVPVPAPIAYAFGLWLTRDWEELGLAERPESFPKQPTLDGKTRYGNWVRLPGRHHTREWWSKVWSDGHWLAGEDAIKAIISTRGSDHTLIPEEAREYEDEDEDQGPEEKVPGQVQRGRPRNKLTPTEKVLARLKNVTSVSAGWSARCPAHADSKNSLSIAEGDDGRALLYCHAGCPIEKIVDALNLQMRDLFAHHQRHRVLRHSRKEVR